MTMSITFSLYFLFLFMSLFNSLQFVLASSLLLFVGLMSSLS
jgi:hypothetical protein